MRVLISLLSELVSWRWVVGLGFSRSMPPRRIGWSPPSDLQPFRLTLRRDWATADSSMLVVNLLPLVNSKDRATNERQLPLISTPTLTHWASVQEPRPQGRGGDRQSRRHYSDGSTKNRIQFCAWWGSKKLQKHDLALWGMKLSITHCDRIRCKRRTAHLLRAFLPCSRCVPCYPQPNGCTAQWITFISQSRKIASTRNQSGFHQTALVQGLSGKAVFLTQPRILSSPHLGTVRRR